MGGCRTDSFICAVQKAYRATRSDRGTEGTPPSILGVRHSRLLKRYHWVRPQASNTGLGHAANGEGDGEVGSAGGYDNPGRIPSEV
jgi:hypothetical protein